MQSELMRGRSRKVSRTSPSVVLNYGETGTVCGKVSRFVVSLTGDVTGFILDQGLHVRYPAEHPEDVTGILSVGTRVSVDGCMRVSDIGDEYFDAINVT